MKQNFITIKDGNEQFSDETRKDVLEFEKGIKEHYNNLLEKGYSYKQIENIVFHSMIELELESRLLLNIRKEN